MDAPRKNKRCLTKTVNPDWYRRYAKVLEYDERTYVQPLREIREEEAMIKAMETPPNEDERAIELSRKLLEARTKKIKLVLQILDGNIRNLDLSSLKPTETPLSRVSVTLEKQEQVLFWRQRVVRPPGYVLANTSKWRLFWDSPDFMSKLEAARKRLKKDKIAYKWRKAVRLLLGIYRFTDAIASIAGTTEDVFKEFKDAPDTTDCSGPLSFQKNYFKAVGVGKSLDQEALFTLSKPESFRTPEQIHMAAKALRVIQTFAEFPIDLQDKMCQVAWYLELEPDKLIIREGQPANSFYFLLAGRVASVKLDGPPWKAQTGFSIINTHGMGCILGEEGICDMGHREYSLWTMEHCKVISVSIDDYHRVCLTSSTEGSNPPHVSFLSQLAFMKFFPMRQLVDNAELNVLLFYYKAGSIITKNATESDFIYVVYKGTCRVLAEISHKNKHKKMVRLPPVECYDLLETVSGTCSLGSQQSNHRHSQSSFRRHSLVQQGSRGTIATNRQSGFDKTTRTVNLMDALAKTWGKNTIADSIKQKEMVTPVNIQLATAGSIEKLVMSKSGEAPKDFVLLKNMREGDVIGLEGLDLGEADDRRPAKIVVVSDGAEVITVLKNFFMDNAGPLMKMDLRASSYIFPEEPQIKSELERRMTWKRFQNNIMERLYGEQERKKNRESR